MIARLALLVPLLGGCVAVLDLDAEGAGAGGATAASTTGASIATDAGASDAAATTSTGTGGSAGAGGACDGEGARFSGGQFLLVDDAMHDALDMDDKLAVGARVRPESPDDGTAYEGAVLSRLDEAGHRGYALEVRRAAGDVALYPELRFYANGILFVCTSSVAIPEAAWSSVVAVFAQGHVGGADAGLWVDGTQTCSLEVGGAKLTKFPTRPVVGAALSVDRAFFQGELADVFVEVAATVPPPLPTGACNPSLTFLLPLDTPLAQTFPPACSTKPLAVTLGAGPSPDPDDPVAWMCP